MIGTPKPRQVRRVLKVCHVIHELGPGGAEKLIVDLARLAPGQGIDLGVVSLMPFGDHEYPRELASLGVDVRSLDLRSRWDPRGRARANKAIAAMGAQVVHSHLKHADMLAGAAAARLGIPHVSTLHVIEDAVGMLGRIKRDVGMRSRESTAAITIAVSEAVRDWYVASFPTVDRSRIIVAYNGVPEPSPIADGLRQALRHEFDVADDGLMVPMVAIMRPGKGHDDLLDAAALLTEEVPVTFVLAGSGPEEHRLRGRCRRLGLDHRVRFAGFRDDIPDLLASSDFVVHPSHAEALPTAVVQAAAAGRPAIGTTVGGTPEVITSDTGILVPVGDPSAIANAVLELAADADRRRWLGKQARERFDTLFDGKAWVARLRALYDGVLAGR